MKDKRIKPNTQRLKALGRQMEQRNKDAKQWFDRQRSLAVARYFKGKKR